MVSKITSWILLITLIITITVSAAGTIQEINIIKTIESPDYAASSLVRYVALSTVTPLMNIGLLTIPGFKLQDMIPLTIAVIIGLVTSKALKLNKALTIMITALLVIALFYAWKTLWYNIYLNSSMSMSINKTVSYELIQKASDNTIQASFYGVPVIYFIYASSIAIILELLNLFGLLDIKRWFKW